MNGDIPIKPFTPATPPPPVDLPPPGEEPGSRALEDALRSSFFIVKIIMVGLVIVFLASGFFTVDPQHKAILLRFGKPVGEGADALLGPGPHWAFPPPIDQKVFIPFTSVQTADSTIGWYQSPDDRAKGMEPPIPTPEMSPATTSYALTADTNIVHVRATVRYTITDPIRFHFDFTDAPVFITNALNNALLFATSAFKVDDILTQRKQVFHEAVAERLRELLNEEQLGVTIDSPVVEEWPPRFLEGKFSEVNSANSLAHRMIEISESYSTTNVAAAKGEAAARIGYADAQRQALVTYMAAEAQAFTNFLPQYVKDPAFYKQFRVMQLWNEILTNSPDKMVQPTGAKEIRLQISRQPLAPRAAAP